MSASIIIDFTERGENIDVQYRLRADESATPDECMSIIAVATQIAKTIDNQFRAIDKAVKEGESHDARETLC